MHDFEGRVVSDTVSTRIALVQDLICFKFAINRIAGICQDKLSLEAVGLKMKTLKNGEIKKLAQGHPATKPLSGRAWAPNKAICLLSPRP